MPLAAGRLAQTLLDEHVTMTQAMQFSAFKKPFEDRIDTYVPSDGAFAPYALMFNTR